MRSEAQKKADGVRRLKVRRVVLDLNMENAADALRLSHLDKQPVITDYLRSLIDADMDRTNGNKDSG